MFRLRFPFLVACSLAYLSVRAASAPTSAASPAALPIPSDQVVAHVTRTVEWYHRMGALQQLPVDSDDVVPRDRLNKSALTALRLAFVFGRAAGALAMKPVPSAGTAGSGATSASTSGAPAPGGPGATPAGQADAASPAQAGAVPPGQASAAPQAQAGALDQAAARLADRISSLQFQLAGVDTQLAHAAPKDQDTLKAQRGEIAAALDLSKEIQATVAQIQRFEEYSDSNGAGARGGLAAQIADLQRTLPEARGDSGASFAGVTGNGAAGTNGMGSASGGKTGTASAAAPAATPAPATPDPNATFRPESAGVITLIGKWFSFEGARRQLSDAMGQTDTLIKELGTVRNAASQEARSLAREDLGAAATDSAQLLQAQQQFDAAATRFKQLSTLLIPLGEQSITLESARTTLGDWRDSLEARNASVARYLVLRLGILLGSIAVVLFISEVWRRATFRYLRDARRRQQFLALRRVAVGLALTLVVLFGLVSEVGSLATYAGLITAGLAVALQNVILAVVAYFFLIGRYGVRVGDRITLANVTGRVVEIGLIRIYLMELIGPELRSSGRMVVLSNAVLFQPTALFKQMPGGDYFWHTVTLTLSGSADVQLAEKRLSEAAASVYEKYRPAIERQHAALQRFIDFETAMPRPEVYARLSAKGLECTVRYPVEPAHAASTDQTMLAAIRDAQSQAPELQLVDGPVLNTET